MKELNEVRAELRQALDAIESALAQPRPAVAMLEDFKASLDGVRTTLMAILTAESPADYQAFVRRFRLRRAAQVCQNVLFGVLDGSITPETTGFDRLQSTVGETLKELDRLRKGGKPGAS
ncbi:MAG: hypothetical protein OEO17_14530 [Gemmatimonadota bacterium]|nr:hypothetical protein [Gemmatimonadota bacterium]MDH3571702.1 hypothetical protein [Gemmatimonadota bacterium]MDH5550050.1 hypothetical protein [Gemmatimonadota bacterium]